MHIETLELRRLFAGISVDPDEGVVHVIGDGGADVVNVRQVGNSIQLTLNATTLLVPSRAPAPEPTIDIQTFDGNDSITIHSMDSLDLRLEIDAGAGADALTTIGHEGIDDIESFEQSIVLHAIGSHTVVGYVNTEAFEVDALGGDDFISPEMQPGVESMLIDAGDGNDLVQAGQSVPLAGRTIQIISGAGDDRVTFGASPPGGAHYSLRDGTIDLAEVGRVSYDAARTERVTIFGGFSGDTFAVATSPSIEYTIVGGDGTAPAAADRLHVLNAGATGLALTTDAFGGGKFTFADRKMIQFTGIEQRDAVDVTPPTLVKFRFEGNNSRDVVAQFSEDVSAQLGKSALQIIDLATNQSVPSKQIQFTIESLPGAPTIARWHIAGAAPSRVRAILQPTLVMDASLNALDTDNNGVAGGPPMSIESPRMFAGESFVLAFDVPAIEALVAPTFEDLLQH